MSILLVSDATSRFIFMDVGGRAIQSVLRDQGKFYGCQGGLEQVQSINRYIYGQADPLSVDPSAPLYGRGYHALEPTKAMMGRAANWMGTLQMLRTQLGEFNNTTLNSHLFSDPALREAFIEDWLRGALRETLLALGIVDHYIAYHAAIIKTDVETVGNDMGVSGAWHCDNHLPQNYLNVFFYLNDVSEHGSGTDLFDIETSLAISRRSGYVGALPKRLDDASHLATRDELERIFAFRPAQGSALAFLGAQSLHRGVFPTLGSRYVVTFALLPLPLPAPEFQRDVFEVKGSEKLVLGSEPPSFFIDPVSENYDPPLDRTNAFAERRQVILADMSAHLQHKFPDPETAKITAVASRVVRRFVHDNESSVVASFQHLVANYGAAFGEAVATFSRPQ